MVCDTRLRRGQSFDDRKREVRKVTETVASGLANGRIGVKIGPDGAIAFTGLSDEDRNGVTDACAYRRVMSTGSALAKAAIAKAEMLAGKKVNKETVASGLHSHDGGSTWHKH